ncbi:DUF447 domain-containing protein [Natrarchaeobius sp. A-rgal3]|uniref:DUF447 domain-containing protein n=1 Tax=Natrarchaeobius versutus TaxID=1679078 RepID=UPI00350F5D45
MTGPNDDPTDTAGDERAADWPISLSGVTESVVTTLGPNDRWNAAALGLFAGDPVTARTWGNTRTKRNFHRRGEGYVQFVDDPVVFAEAALSLYEIDDPILEEATAWVRIAVDSVETGTDDGTEWEEWAIEPTDAAIVRTEVPTIDRGFNAVVEATIAASRLDVDGYDESTLRERLGHYDSIVDRAGSPREREALERVRKHSNW